MATKDKVDLLNSLLIVLKHHLDNFEEESSLLPIIKCIIKEGIDIGGSQPAIKLESQVQIILRSYFTKVCLSWKDKSSTPVLPSSFALCLQLASRETTVHLLDILNSTLASRGLTLQIHTLIVSNVPKSNLPIDQILSCQLLALRDVLAQDDVENTKQISRVLPALLSLSTDDIFSEIEEVLLLNYELSPSSTYMVTCSLTDWLISKRRILYGLGKLLVAVSSVFHCITHKFLQLLV